MQTYVIVAHMPACSAVLFVNPNLEDPYKVTILTEDTRYACIAYAAGFRAGSEVEHRGSIELPAGNPATSFAERIFATR